MCPLDVTMGKAIAYFAMFLPTSSVYENPDKTYKLWFDELIGFWRACGNNPNWEPPLMGMHKSRFENLSHVQLHLQGCWLDLQSTILEKLTGAPVCQLFSQEFRKCSVFQFITTK